MKTNALKGMKDILPAEQKLRDYVQGKILETYRASGFERISTPMLEDAENLDKSDGGDNLNLIFKVLKRGEKLDAALAANPVNEKALSDMGLRYDLTLPLTRFFAANRNELQFPFKVIQTDRVFRAERPQKGRSREFVQCDIDILGDSSCNAEVELIDVTARALLNIGFNNFVININDRRILRNMLENMGFAAETLDSVCITFDKMDKIGASGVENELREKQLPETAIKALVDFISKGEGGAKITLDDVASKCADSAIANDLKYIISTVEKISGGKYKIAYTPNLVRGQGYYTGVVFEIASPDFSGAVGGGGRYDNLIGKFIGQQIPAVGFSIGFERICGILLEQNYKIPGAKEKCALLYDDSVEFPVVIAEAEKLRADYSVSILKKAKKPGPQYDMLEKQGYTKFATFKDGAITIK
ncbi:MAG: histidine--tRNA ligase [Treponema sp.]|nr:histidine--tRNA ligase [Treponema sp.]